MNSRRKKIRFLPCKIFFIFFHVVSQKSSIITSLIITTTKTTKKLTSRNREIREKKNYLTIRALIALEKIQRKPLNFRRIFSSNGLASKITTPLTTLVESRQQYKAYTHKNKITPTREREKQHTPRSLLFFFFLFLFPHPSPYTLLS